MARINTKKRNPLSQSKYELTPKAVYCRKIKGTLIPT